MAKSMRSHHTFKEVLNAEKNKSITTPTQILTIPKESLVLMCGAPNSGKTHLSKKLFSTRKDVVLICTDEIAHENARKACIFETYESLMEKTIKTVLDIVKKAVAESKTVVLDATSHYTQNRLAMIEEFKPMFKNIILLVIDLDFADLEKHGVKEQSNFMKRFDFYTPGPKETHLIATYIKNLFMNGDIYKGVDTVYRISSKTINSCKAVIV